MSDYFKKPGNIEEKANTDSFFHKPGDLNKETNDNSFKAPGNIEEKANTDSFFHKPGDLNKESNGNNFFHKPDNLNNKIVSSAEEINGFINEVATGKRSEQPTVGGATMFVNFDRLKEMVNEGYNIIKASYFEQMNMIEVTFDVPYKSKTR